ncbi:MAG: hypothetical protein KatS3mg104_1576 [Phycisphaerae bacterium]|nr:MAG: hypothetical protein KatS3mg104_1576 [Phycisphaerae bacterium]
MTRISGKLVWNRNWFCTPKAGFRSGKKTTPTTDLCRNRRRDFFIARIITLPANLTLGRYVLKVSITDPQSRSDRGKPAFPWQWWRDSPWVRAKFRSGFQVPKMRSPASPSPGRMYPLSFNSRSTDSTVNRDLRMVVGAKPGSPQVRPPDT